MREIKFRGYSKSFSMMFDYDMLEMASAGMVDICKRELKKIDPEATELQMGLFLPTYDKDLILMQYTGLKDKNGKEIYEGDIVKIQTVKVNEDDYVIGTVAYSEFEGMYVTNKGYILGRVNHRTEVIGNIYQSRIHDFEIWEED